MRVLRSIVRWLFALQVLLCGWQVLVAFTSPVRHASTLLASALPYLSAVLTVVFGMAWYTTRQSDGKRKPWGIAASCIQLAVCVYPLSFFVGDGVASLSLVSSMLLPIGLSIAGVVMFSRRMHTEAARPRPRRVQGDRTTRILDQAVAHVATAAQLAAMYLWWKFSRTHWILIPSGVMWFALLMVGDLLTVLIHETAHSVVALLFKMKLLSFQVGPLAWRRQAGRWKFSFNKSRLLSVDGGVGVVPCHPEAKRWHEVAMIAAGPASNVLVALCALPFVLHAGPETNPMLWTMLAFAVSTSFITVVLNLVPFLSESGAYSDGARIVQLLSDSPVADLHRAQHAIKAMLVTALRHRDLDVDLLRRASAVCQDPLQGTVLRLVMAAHFEDRDLKDEARTAFEEAERYCCANVPVLPASLHTIFVFGNALERRDAAATRAWWDNMQAGKPKDFDTDYYLAEACLHWMEGRPDNAMQAWRKADTEARRMPAYGAYEMDRQRCKRLKFELDKAESRNVSVVFHQPDQGPFPCALPV